mgnify:CR=1 FL=1
MKKIFSLTAVLLIAAIAMAQQKVYIKFKADENAKEYLFSDIDSIYFSEPEVTPTPTPTPAVEVVDLGLSVKWAKEDCESSTTWSSNWSDESGTLRMPTQAEFEELINGCTWVYDSTNKGFVGTSKSNGETITLLYNSGYHGYYWTSDELGYIDITDSHEELLMSFKTAVAADAHAIRPVYVGSTTPSDGKYSTPEAIDLGLSVKWGSFNLGANSVTDYGNYYGWGDATGLLTVGDRDGLYGRNAKNENQVNCHIGGNPELDIVAKELGGKWRLPTPEEIEELQHCTISQVRDYNKSGVNGYTFERNGKTLFFPAAGYFNDSGQKDLGQFAEIWSDSTGTNSSYAYYYRIIPSDNKLTMESVNRKMHLSIRPVYDDGSGSGNNNNDDDDDNKTPAEDETDKTNAIVAGSDKNSKTGIIPQDGVDMGTGVKWARWNLGATAKKGVDSMGQYFAWGDTISRQSFTEDEYMSPYKGVAAESVTEEAPYGFMYIDAKYDAATYLWGKAWSIPTSGHFLLLMNNCNIEWTTQDGVNGYLFTSKINGNQLFFPAGGFKWGEAVAYEGYSGYYWTNQVYNTGGADKMVSWASSLNFFDDTVPSSLSGLDRFAGMFIRPVMK